MFDSGLLDSFSTDLVLSWLLDGYVLFAEAPLASLIFLGLTFHFAGRFDVPNGRYKVNTSRQPRRIGLLSSLLFCIAGYAFNGRSAGDVGDYVELAFRGFLLFLIVEGTAAIALTAISWLWSILTSLCRWIRDCLARLGRRISAFFRSRRENAPETSAAPAPPPSFNEKVQQAKDEFEARCDAFRSAGLDQDELEAAILDARQKYVRRLQGILNNEVS